MKDKVENLLEQLKKHENLLPIEVYTAYQSCIKTIELEKEEHVCIVEGDSFGEYFDTCVIDEGNPHQCPFAEQLTCKEGCIYWVLKSSLKLEPNND